MQNGRPLASIPIGKGVPESGKSGSVHPQVVERARLPWVDYWSALAPKAASRVRQAWAGDGIPLGFSSRGLPRELEIVELRLIGLGASLEWREVPWRLADPFPGLTPPSP